MATFRRASISTAVSNKAIAANSCYTGFKKIPFDYLWIIEETSFYDAESKFVGSSKFKDNEGNTEWQLCLYWRSDSTAMQITLESINSGKSLELKAIYSISILNGKNEEVKTVKMIKPNDFKSKKSCHAVIPTTKILNTSGELLLGDTMSILCKIIILESFMATRKSYSSESTFIDKTSISSLAVREFLLAEDLQKLLENGKFSDVTLVADGRDFPVHKAILSARSEVFATMFEHQMKENTLQRVVIGDIASDVIAEMLRFIYTNKSPNVVQMARELLVAANKYALTQLLQMSEYELMCGINVESAAELLVLADLSNAIRLKSDTIKFINLNVSEVIKTDGWKSLVKTHAKLVVDVLQEAVDYPVFE